MTRVYTNGIILDNGSLDAGDLDFSVLEKQVKHWTMYEHTEDEDIATRIKNADVIISNKVYLGEKEIAQLTNNKLICIAATGTNNVDLKAAAKHKIPVCNVTGYATPSVVQHVFSLILALNTHLCDYRKLVNENHWSNSKHFCLLNFPITELEGKTLGIIGYGELGKAVANVAKAFGVNVVVAESMTGKKDHSRVSLETLYSQSDIISLHCPLTDETKDLIDKRAFAQMKTSAILINAARGGIVNEADLLNALKNQDIAAAGLDVLHEEPPTGNALIASQLPNLIITPHIAWASQASRQRLVNEIAKNIAAFAKGESRNQVA